MTQEIYQSPHYQHGCDSDDPCVRYICDQIGWGEFRRDYLWPDEPYLVDCELFT